MKTILLYISIFVKIMIILILIFILYKMNNMSLKIIEKYEDNNDDENIKILISAANIAKDDANTAADNIDITMTPDIVKSSLQIAEDKLKNAYNLINIAFNLLYSKSKTLNYIEPETIPIQINQQPLPQIEEIPPSPPQPETTPQPPQSEIQLLPPVAITSLLEQSSPQVETQPQPQPETPPPPPQVETQPPPLQPETPPPPLQPETPPPPLQPETQPPPLQPETPSPPQVEASPSQSTLFYSSTSEQSYNIPLQQCVSPERDTDYKFDSVIPKELKTSASALITSSK